uniref:Uncharacterized protein n=1 Tax=Schistocephalus solidus TaxID=70667 RepID=A0A0X3NSS7_SCHSO
MIWNRRSFQTVYLNLPTAVLQTSSKKLSRHRLISSPRPLGTTIHHVVSFLQTQKPCVSHLICLIPPPILHRHRYCCGSAPRHVSQSQISLIPLHHRRLIFPVVPQHAPIKLPSFGSRIHLLLSRTQSSSIHLIEQTALLTAHSLLYG